MNAEESSTRLIFKTPTVDDLDFMLALIKNDDVVRYIPGITTGKRQIRGWLQALSKINNGDNEFLIVRKDTGEPIGECRMTPQDRGESWEIGYMLMPEYWKQGYGTETVQWIINRARAAGITKLTATVHTQNKASDHLLQKMGFRQNVVCWMLIYVNNKLEDVPMNGYALELKADRSYE